MRVSIGGELPEMPNLKRGEGVSNSIRNPRNMTSLMKKLCFIERRTKKHSNATMWGPCNCDHLLIVTPKLQLFTRKMGIPYGTGNNNGK